MKNSRRETGREDDSFAVHHLTPGFLRVNEIDPS